MPQQKAISLKAYDMPSFMIIYIHTEVFWYLQLIYNCGDEGPNLYTEP